MDSSVSDHLVQEFRGTPTPYTLTDEDVRAIGHLTLPVWIAQKLLRTNFRRGPAREATRTLVLERVQAAIVARVPLKIVLGFGGYKHFAAKSAPLPDWSEFFNLVFLREWVAPILAAYEHGVVIEYESEDIILELANGYARTDLDAYSHSFEELIRAFNQYNVNTLRFSYVRARTQYDPQTLKSLMEELIPDKRSELLALPASEREERSKRSARNLPPTTTIDALEAKAQNLAFLDADYTLRGSYFDDPYTVPAVFTFGLDIENVGSWPVIGSTRSSFVDFWVGNGILEVRADRFVDRIVSPTQYEGIAEKLERTPVEGIPFSGFDSIECYSGILS